MCEGEGKSFPSLFKGDRFQAVFLQGDGQYYRGKEDNAAFPTNFPASLFAARCFMILFTHSERRREREI
jgi:hypothetical protein